MGSPIRILLVEDSPTDALLLVEELKHAKIRVKMDIVTDGLQALDYLRRKGEHEGASTPDLILLDLNLPRMDGRTVLQRIKADEALRRLPVVVLTSSQSERDILESYDLQASAFITKPVDFDAFGEIVRGIESFWFSVVRYPVAQP